MSLEVVEVRLGKYDEVVTKWNENIGSYFVKLTLYAKFYDAAALERDIHDQLQGVGVSLERLVRARRANVPVSNGDLVAIERKLNGLQGAAFEFNRDLLAVVEKVRDGIYLGSKIELSQKNLEYFSNWQLIKALFIRDVDSFSVFRSPSDLQ